MSDAAVQSSPTTTSAADATATGTACTALLLAGGWECERCGLAWDDGDKPPSCQPMTFARMRLAALEEAERIEFSQEALTTNTPTSPSIRRYRYKPQLKRAQELWAIVRLIERIADDRAIVERLKSKGKSSW